VTDISSEATLPPSLGRLPAWDERSTALAAMLNPVLVSVLIASAADRYEHETGSPMPWELSFLVVPMSLHRGTRDVIPNRINSNLAKWVEDNAVLRAGLAPRARSLAPYVREGFRVGVRHAAITVHAGGGISGSLAGRLPSIAHDYIRPLTTTAAFLGRWFGHMGSSSTVFAVLGVKP
jgi:hypothetical protein